MSGDERGQAHALEGISAALLVVLGLLFAVQVSVTGPLASNTAREAISEQLQGSGESALAAAESSGTLGEAAVYWNASRPAFKDSSTSGPFRGTYVDGAPPELFDEILNDSLSDRTVYNVDIAYWDGTERQTKAMVYSGRPTVGAVTVSRAVTLYDDDRIPSGERLAEVGGERFYVGDQSDGEVYAVVYVEVTLWRA